MNTTREHQSAVGRQQIMLRLAVKGQLYEKEDNANYVFPKSDDKQWLDSVPNDPRKDIQPLRLEGNGVECFALWFNGGKAYYAYRRLLPGRGGSDCGMVVLCSNRFIYNGTLLVVKLRDIFDYCIRLSSSAEIQDEFIREKLSDLSFVPYGIQGLSPEAQQPAEPMKNAYRTYSTEDDLAYILENPYQSVYNRYGRILVLQKDLITQATPGIDEITDKVRQNYFVRNSNDSAVEGGRNIVEASQTFKLKYMKSGYGDAVTDALRVGTPSNYFTIQNNEIIVRPASEVGIIFKKDIMVKVTDNHDNPIENWDCLIPTDRGATRSCRSLSHPGYITLPDGTFKCQIMASGYQPKTVSIDTKAYNAFSVKLANKGTEVSFHLLPAWGNPFVKHDENPAPIEATIINKDPFYEKYGEDLDGSRPYPRYYVSKSRPLYILILISLLTLGLGFFLGHTFNGGSTTEEGGGDSQSSVTDPKQADINYLNRHEKWERDKLKSKEYQKFFDELVKNPDNIKDKHDEITNKEWKRFRDEKSYRQERIENLKRCGKLIDWKKINETEEDREKIDEDYLIKNIVWEVDKLLSKKYKDLINKLKNQAFMVAKNYREVYSILEKNEGWLDFVENSAITKTPYSAQIGKMLVEGVLDWSKIDKTEPDNIDTKAQNERTGR